MTESWPEYYKESLKKPLHPIFAELDKHLPEGGVAIDLGCGVKTGTLHLLSKGFKVLAVDQEPDALAILRDNLPEGAEAHLLKSEFQTLGLEPDSLDVAVAAFSLFFLRSWEFGQFWQRLTRALKPGGVFAGQFLGVNDDWADRGYTVHSAAEVAKLLEGFEVLHYEEVERDGETLLREPKHWHVFHVVARKTQA